MKVVLVSSPAGDWTGIYVDGLLKAEGHSFREETVLNAVGVNDVRSIERQFEGWLPLNLADIEEQEQIPFGV